MGASKEYAPLASVVAVASFEPASVSSTPESPAPPAAVTRPESLQLVGTATMVVTASLVRLPKFLAAGL